MAAAAATTATESSTNTNSPRSPGDGKHNRTPWAQIVRGESSDSALPLPEKSESSPPESIPATEGSEKGNSGNVAKKPAWNKPGNGVSAPAGDSISDQGVLMGAASWPALSESTRLPQKLSALASSDSPKTEPEASVSVTVSQGSATSHSQQQPRQSSASTNYSSSTNTGAPTRQRPMRRGGGGGGNRQGGFPRGPPPSTPPPTFGVSDMAGLDPSLRGIRPTGTFGSFPYPANDHPNQRGSNRRGHYVHHGHGDGRNNFHGVRRDEDQSNHDRSSSQTSHVRGALGHPHRPPVGNFPGLMGPQVPPPSPYHPIAYRDAAPYYYFYPGMPYFAPGPPPPPCFVHPELCAAVVAQIDYYFSDDNLVKDEYLKSKMDHQGWVSIELIADFPRIKRLNVKIPSILDFLRASTIVEVQGDRVRRRNEWMKWVARNQSLSNSGPCDNLATSLRNVSLEEVNQDSTTAMMHPNSASVPAH